MRKYEVDIIKPDTAKTICTYGSEYYKGESAVTVNEYGKGRVYYVGCDLDNDAMKELVRIIAKANVKQWYTEQNCGGC